jgi:hypothetical protein
MSCRPVACRCSLPGGSGSPRVAVRVRRLTPKGEPRGSKRTTALSRVNAPERECSNVGMFFSNLCYSHKRPKLGLRCAARNHLRRTFRESRAVSHPDDLYGRVRASRRHPGIEATILESRQKPGAEAAGTRRQSATAAGSRHRRAAPCDHQSQRSPVAASFCPHGECAEALADPPRPREAVP